MFDALFVVSIIGSCYQVIKESFTSVIPAENWANKKLYHQDLMDGISAEQRMKNVKNGKYRLIETYPEPHKDPKTGRIIIENSKLYKEDLFKYGATQTYQWVKQGKYNLTPEELKKERERIKKEFEKLYGFSM